MEMRHGSLCDIILHIQTTMDQLDPLALEKRELAETDADRFRSENYESSQHLASKWASLSIPANPAVYVLFLVLSNSIRYVDPAGLYTAYYLAPNIVPKFPIFYWKNLHVINRPKERYLSPCFTSNV